MLNGANATGKSNIRAGLRLLHGIGQGYTRAEIMGGVYRNGKEVWAGIRGGSPEHAFQGASTFALAWAFAVQGKNAQQRYTIRYRTEIQPGGGGTHRLSLQNSSR